MNFKKYKRKGLSEMVSVTEFIEAGGDLVNVSISEPDRLTQDHDSVKFNKGFVARNPANHADMWYVAFDYHQANLEEANESVEPELDFYGRLLKEKQELDERINKLYGFIQSPAFKNIPAAQIGLLQIQVYTMRAYSQILEERISLLDKTGNSPEPPTQPEIPPSFPGN